MNDVMKYIVDCIKNNKKASGRKINSFNQEYSLKDAYVYVHGSKTCEECQQEASFKNISSGFSRFCSRQCANMHNNKNPKIILKQKEKQKERYKNIDLIHEEIINNAINEYLKSNLTIREIAEKNNVSYSKLRRKLSEKKLTKKRNSYEYDSVVGKREDKISIKSLNEEIDSKISIQKDQIEETLSKGYTSQYFADIYGCSKNFICKKFKKHGIRIPNNSISSYEKKLQELLEVAGIKYYTNTKKIINKELDIYIPNKKVAVEVNGIYWHSEKYIDSKYHLNKTIQCAQKNIELLHFWDYEIDKKEHIVYSIILNRLNISDRIPARKCVVKELSFKTKKNFLIENHISGDVPSSKNFGLYFNDELISVMTFGKSRFNKKYEYELLRFCNKKYKNIIGGKEKLFNFFLRNYNPNSIISYSQKRLFSGNMYKKLNFKFSHDTLPNYFWAKNKELIVSRYKSQKHLLNTNKTEKEYMQSLNYYRVFDCGNSVWVWNNAENSL